MIEKAIEAVEKLAQEIYNSLSNQKSKDRQNSKKKFYLASEALDRLEEIKRI